MADLTEQSLEEFLDSVGDDTPAPGGGTSSAITVALAAALVEMSARLASDDEAAEAARGMRTDALRLAEEELTSYGPVLEAETAADRTTALDGASEPPAQIAETAGDVAELGVKVAEHHVRPGLRPRPRRGRQSIEGARIRDRVGINRAMRG